MRHGRGLVAAKAVAGLMGMLMITWAATIGPSALLEGDGPGFLIGPPPGLEVFSAGDPARATGDDGNSPMGDLVVSALGVFLVAGALLLVAVLAVSACRGLGRLRDAARARRGAADPVETGFLVVDPATRLARTLAEDAGRQRALLAQGSPRNGIVHCWHRLEELAGESGLGRRAWETPGEFALRLLSTVDADEDAAYRLTRLYREARFSQHELDESARDQALEALATIHLGLADRTGSRS